jgi:hypothetical protein
MQQSPNRSCRRTRRAVLPFAGDFGHMPVCRLLARFFGLEERRDLDPVLKDAVSADHAKGGAAIDELVPGVEQAEQPGGLEGRQPAEVYDHRGFPVEQRDDRLIEDVPCRQVERPAESKDRGMREIRDLKGECRIGHLDPLLGEPPVRGPDVGCVPPGQESKTPSTTYCLTVPSSARRVRLRPAEELADPVVANAEEAIMMLGPRQRGCREERVDRSRNCA